MFTLFFEVFVVYSCNLKILNEIFFPFNTQATTKINVAVDKLPQFCCCATDMDGPGPQHIGTIHIGSERYGKHRLLETSCGQLLVVSIHKFLL